MRTVSKSLFSLLALLFFALSVAFHPSVALAEDDEGVGDINRFLMCKVFDFDGASAEAYTLAHTDKANYLLRSKSVNEGIDTVDGFLNSALFLGLPSRSAVNEPIIGYAPDKDAVDTDEKAEVTYNGGDAHSVYERFGVAGLRFTNYFGEWHYTEVDVCKGTVDPSGTNGWYEGRQQPTASWEASSTSKDLRSKQVVGLGSEVNFSFAGWFPTFLLSLMKVLFVFAVAFLRLAFTDIVSLTGIGGFVYGGEGSSGGGIVGSLFSSVYFPLLGLALLSTALYLVYFGLAKRQYRMTLGVIGRAIGAFLLSILIWVNPALIISIPNNVAVVGQAIVMSAMSGSIDTGGVLCSSDYHSEELPTSGDVSTKAAADKLVNGIGESVSNSIGCTLWETTLFRPWARAQFGTEWDQLFAKGYEIAPGKAIANSDENAAIVGNAEVPLGGGETINNWAVFQLSTLTDAHAKADQSGERPTSNSGVNDDFYRVVDAFSNVYYEKQSSALPGAEGATYLDVRSGDKPLPTWSVWAGDQQGYRFGVMAEAFILNAVVTIPLFSFALIAVSLALGLVILACFAPIFLVLGSAGPKGEDIMKGYFETMLNIMMKRIAIGGVLILSITLLNTALVHMRTVSYGQGLALLIILAFAVKLLWSKVSDLISFFRFSNRGGQISQATDDAAARMKRGVALVGSAAGSYAAGAATGKVKGVDPNATGRAAFKRNIENALYRNPNARYALSTAEAAKQKRRGMRDIENSFCVSCGAPMKNSEGMVGSRSTSGDYMCAQCTNDLLVSDGNLGDFVEIFITDAKTHSFLGSEGAEKALKAEQIQTGLRRKLSTAPDKDLVLRKSLQDIVDALIEEVDRIPTFLKQLDEMKGDTQATSAWTTLLTDGASAKDVRESVRKLSELIALSAVTQMPSNLDTTDLIQAYTPFVERKLAYRFGTTVEELDKRMTEEKANGTVE